MDSCGFLAKNIKNSDNIAILLDYERNPSLLKGLGVCLQRCIEMN